MDNVFFVLCNQYGWQSSHLGLSWPSSGHFCSFLRCKSHTSKIHKNHCKNFGFGNMSLLEGPQIGANLTLFARKIIQKPCKHTGCLARGSQFLGCFFMFCFFHAKLDVSQLGVLSQQELYFQGSRLRFSCIFGMFFQWFSRSQFWSYTMKISSLICKIQRLSGPHAFLMHTKKLVF